MAAAKNINWDEEPLGLQPDPVIAERLGVNVSSVYLARKKRNIKKYDKYDFVDLGVDTDTFIAKKLGITIAAVGIARKFRNIERAPFKRKENGGKVNYKKEPLGKIKDADIARINGVSINAVFAARKRRNIKAFFKKKTTCYCGKEFIPVQPNQKCCSQICSQDWRVHNRRTKQPCVIMPLLHQLSALKRELKKRSSHEN